MQGSGGDVSSSYYFAFRINKIGAIFYSLIFPDGDVVEFEHVALEVSRFGLFSEDVSAARNPVIEREGRDFQRIVFKHCLRSSVRDYVVFYLERALLAEEIEHAREYLGSLLERVYGYGSTLSAGEGEGRYHACQPKAVVAVKMGDENVVKPRELQLHAAQ